MYGLAVIWSHSNGEHVVWETEHLFGYDVLWGRLIDGLAVPLLRAERQVPLGPLGRLKACAALDALDAGMWAWAVSRCGTLRHFAKDDL